MKTDSRTIEGSDVQQLVPRGPGEVFKQARERARISIDKVSQFLHLPREVIEALESDQQDLLPEPTYVKGYIRSYARYLELDPNPLIEGYIKYVYAPPAPPASPLQVPKVTKAQKAKARRGPLDIVLIAFLSCVFVFLSVWWFYPQPTKFIAEIKLMVSGLISDVTEPISSEVDDEGLSEGRVSEQASHIHEEIGASSSEIASTVADTSVDEGINRLATEPSAAMPAESADSIKAEKDAEPETNEIATPSTIASDEGNGFEIQGRAAPGGDSLTLTFKDHSWTEVYDANKERLLFGLVNSGSVKELQGKAPFRILLGNSSAVTINFNGEPYDHSEFERFDKTARFLVNNSAGN